MRKPGEMYFLSCNFTFLMYCFQNFKSVLNFNSLPAGYTKQMFSGRGNVELFIAVQTRRGIPFRISNSLNMTIK